MTLELLEFECMACCACFYYCTVVDVVDTMPVAGSAFVVNRSYWDAIVCNLDVLVQIKENL